MSYASPVNTLSYQLGTRPLMVLRDLSTVPMSNVIERINSYDLKERSPEAEAITFYLLQHGMGVLQQKCDKHELLDPLRLSFCDTFSRTLSNSAQMLFYYLLYITTRESRHTSLTADQRTKLKNEFDDAGRFLINNFKGTEKQAWDRLRTDPPNAIFGDFVDAIVYCFEKGKFSSGYGGPKWAEIARCLRKVVYGETTLEQMLDEAWTLCHNNGPIFNKGLYFSMYGSSIYRILDVQRSGQIPELIVHDEMVRSLFADNPVVKYALIAYKLIADVGPFVDWFKVEALGALKSYKGDQAKQLTAKQETPYSKVYSDKLKAAKEMMDLEAKQKYYYSPTQFVKIVERNS